MPKIYIRTFGCTANQADSEVMAGLLARAGYELVSSPKDADLVIFNTCSLKTPTETRLFREIRALSPKQKIIVAGCFPLSFPEDKRMKKFSLLGSFDFKKVAEAVRRTLNGERAIYLSREGEEKLCLPRIRENPKIAKIVISKGCLGGCSFCAGKFARGKLVSCSPKKILCEVRQAVRNGCERIYLTSQDCGCYGFDIGTNIIELLKKVLKEVKGTKILVRVGMMNPQWALKFLNELVEILNRPNMMKFLHIPVQSGSDKVLRLMKREYSIQQFREVVKRVRKEVKGVSISTDIIVGFPGETKQDFQKTIKLLEWLKPEVLNLTKFYERPGIEANKIEPKVPWEEIKRRSRIITEKFNPKKVKQLNK